MSDLNRNEYVNTSTGQDGTKLVKILKNFLSENSSVLLLGIGSGRDIGLLSENYKVTGSDFSKLLINVYQTSNPNADLINLDLVELNTDRKFDAIFSNKVLHQMDEKDLKQSLQNQKKLLNDGGIVIHSFWTGIKTEDHHGLQWTYYTEESLAEQIPKEFEIVELKTFKEKIDHDSLYMILKKMK